MKNIIFEQKKIKLCNKLHCVDNKSEMTQHVLKISKVLQISLLPKYVK